MTISELPQDHFTFEVKTPIEASDVEKNAFLAFHKAACQKSGNNLKPTSIEDVNEADFIVTIMRSKTQTVGQCLLYKGHSTAKKIEFYPQQAKVKNALIITSLAGKRAIPKMLETLEYYAITSNITTLFAKAREDNGYAHEVFEELGYQAEGPEHMGSDRYRSYLYKRHLGAFNQAQDASHQTVAPV